MKYKEAENSKKDLNDKSVRQYSFSALLLLLPLPRAVTHPAGFTCFCSDFVDVFECVHGFSGVFCQLLLFSPPVSTSDIYYVY